MSRISFLVGFDRTAQSSPADIAAAVETDNTAEVQSRRALRRKGEDDLAQFWEETRIGLVNRMRYDTYDVITCVMGKHLSVSRCVARTRWPVFSSVVSTHISVDTLEMLSQGYIRCSCTDKNSNALYVGVATCRPRQRGDNIECTAFVAFDKPATLFVIFFPGSEPFSLPPSL